MEQATFLVQEYNFQRLELFGQLSRGNVSVDIENLARVRFSETGQDGKCTSTNGSFKWPLVYPSNLANQTILVLVQEIGSEDSRGDRTGPSSQFF